MKIAIVGAQNTGKTTLLDALRKDPEISCPVIRETVRSLKKEGKIEFLNKEFDYQSQKTILNQHLINALTNRSMITDRCAIDALAYTLYNLKENPGHPKLGTLVQLAEASIDKIDRVVYCPTGLIEMEEDGVRSTDIDFQHDVAEIMEALIDEYFVKKGKPVLWMTNLDMTWRVDNVKKLYHQYRH